MNRSAFFEACVDAVGQVPLRELRVNTKRISPLTVLHNRLVEIQRSNTCLGHMHGTTTVRTRFLAAAGRGSWLFNSFPCLQRPPTVLVTVGYDLKSALIHHLVVLVCINSSFSVHNSSFLVQNSSFVVPGTESIALNANFIDINGHRLAHDAAESLLWGLS